MLLYSSKPSLLKLCEAIPKNQLLITVVCPILYISSLELVVLVQLKGNTYIEVYIGFLNNIYRAVMGSVSNYLIRNCPCPVTVCKLTNEEIDARKELSAKKQATFNEVLSK